MILLCIPLYFLVVELMAIPPILAGKRVNKGQVFIPAKVQKLNDRLVILWSVLCIIGFGHPHFLAVVAPVGFVTYPVMYAFEARHFTKITNSQGIPPPSGQSP